MGEGFSSDFLWDAWLIIPSRVLSSLPFIIFCTIPPKKPANLLIDYSGVLKISDFGLAKIRPDPTKTEEEAFVMTGETGSYRFMAPEVSPILGRGLQNPLFYAFLTLLCLSRASSTPLVEPL